MHVLCALLLLITDPTRLPLVAVVEARTNPAGAAKVVETWGEPDASRAIVAASLADRAADPVSVPFPASLRLRLYRFTDQQGVPLICF